MIENGVENEQPIPFDAKNFLFKQARVRNTDWILGYIVYSGRDSKVQKNSGNSRVKNSKMQNVVDAAVITLFSIQVCLS